MNLREIYCQDNAISLLQRAYSSARIPHAYIFAGRDGVGKLTVAKAWAKMLLCEDRNQKSEIRSQKGEKTRFFDSCGECKSCKLFEADSHPDFNLIYKELREFTKDGKGKAAPVDMPIDVIREFLIEKVSNRPTESVRRVFVVTETEKLNAASQNALLKVLEEPPAYCSIILLCTRLENLLPTTRSRCQIIRFGAIDEDRILEALKKNGLEGKKAVYFARLADGSIGDALQMASLEQDGGRLFEVKTAIVRSLADIRYEQSLEIAAQFLAFAKDIGEVWVKQQANVSKTDINRRAIGFVLEAFAGVFQDAMKVGIADEGKIVNTDQLAEIKRIAALKGSEGCACAVEEVYEAQRRLEANVNEKLIFERLLLKLASFDRIQV